MSVSYIQKIQLQETRYIGQTKIYTGPVSVRNLGDSFTFDITIPALPPTPEISILKLDITGVPGSDALGSTYSGQFQVEKNAVGAPSIHISGEDITVGQIGTIQNSISLTETESSSSIQLSLIPIANSGSQFFSLVIPYVDSNVHGPGIPVVIPFLNVDGTNIDKDLFPNFINFIIQPSNNKLIVDAGLLPYNTNLLTIQKNTSASRNFVQLDFRIDPFSDKITIDYEEDLDAIPAIDLQYTGVLDTSFSFLHNHPSGANFNISTNLSFYALTTDSDPDARYLYISTQYGISKPDGNGGTLPVDILKFSIFPGYGARISTGATIQNPGYFRYNLVIEFLDGNPTIPTRQVLTITNNTSSVFEIALDVSSKVFAIQGYNVLGAPASRTYSFTDSTFITDLVDTIIQDISTTIPEWTNLEFDLAEKFKYAKVIHLVDAENNGNPSGKILFNSAPPFPYPDPFTGYHNFILPLAQKDVSTEAVSITINDLADWLKDTFGSYGLLLDWLETPDLSEWRDLPVYPVLLTPYEQFLSQGLGNNEFAVPYTFTARQSFYVNTITSYNPSLENVFSSLIPPESLETVQSLADYINDLTSIHSTWVEKPITYLSGTHPNAGFYGYDIAISADGNTVVVGKPGSYTGDTFVSSSYIYVKSGTTWSQQKDFSLIFGDTSGGQFGLLGKSVAISADGNVVVLGSPKDIPNGIVSGRAVIATRSGTTWTQQPDTLHLIGDDHSGFFGVEVAISGDGNTIVVGSPWSSASAGVDGACYVYVLTAGTWTQKQKLTPTGLNGGNFGKAIAVSYDGSVIAVGSPLNSALGGVAGKVFVYTKTASTWTLEQIITTTANDTGNFGISVALNSNGSVLAVGSPYDNMSLAGRVFVFTHSGSSWTQQQIISPSAPTDTDNGRLGLFGTSVAFTPDGTTLVVGKPGVTFTLGGYSPGGIYTFSRSAHAWIQLQKLVNDSSLDINIGFVHNFGKSVSISSDGQIVTGKPVATASDPSPPAFFTFSISNTLTSRTFLNKLPGLPVIFFDAVPNSSYANESTEKLLFVDVLNSSVTPTIITSGSTINNTVPELVFAPESISGTIEIPLVEGQNIGSLVNEINSNSTYNQLIYAFLVDPIFATDDQSSIDPKEIVSLLDNSVTLTGTIDQHLSKSYSFDQYPTLFSLVSAISSDWAAAQFEITIDPGSDLHADAISIHLNEASVDIASGKQPKHFNGTVTGVAHPLSPETNVTLNFNVAFASGGNPNTNTGIQVAIGGYESDGTFFLNNAPNAFFEPVYNTAFPISFSTTNADVVYLLVRTRENLASSSFSVNAKNYAGLVTYSNGSPAYSIKPFTPTDTKFTNFWTEGGSTGVPVAIAIPVSSSVMNVNIEDIKELQSINVQIVNAPISLNDFGFLAINRTNNNQSQTVSKVAETFGLVLDNRGAWDVLISPEAILSASSSGTISHLGVQYNRETIDDDEGYDFELATELPADISGAVSISPIPNNPQVWVLRIEYAVKRYLAQLRKSTTPQNGCSIDLDFNVTGRSTGVKGVARVSVFYDYTCVFDIGLCDSFWNLITPPTPTSQEIVQNNLAFAYDTLIACDKLTTNIQNNTAINVPILTTISNIPTFKNGNALLLMKSNYTPEIQGFYFPTGNELDSIELEDCSSLNLNLPLIRRLNKEFLLLPGQEDPINDIFEIRNLLQTENSYLWVRPQFYFPPSDDIKDCGPSEIVLVGIGYQFKDWISGTREDSVVIGLNLIFPQGVYSAPDMNICYRYYYKQRET